jgi:integrase
MAERTRKGNLESWISDKPNERGYHEAKVWMGLKADGSPDRRHVQRKSAAAVRRRVRELERDRDAGVAARPGKVPTVREMLTRHLDVVLPQRGRAPRTIADYRSKCRNDIFPRWGNQKIDRLLPEHLEDGYAEMLAAGHKPSHVLKVHRILSSAYAVQVKRGNVARNPCTFVDEPEIGDSDRASLTRAQARAVLAEARKRPGWARWAAGLTCGTRQGETLGLRWDSLEIDVPAGEPGVMRAWVQLQRLTWEHGCGAAAAAAARKAGAAQKAADKAAADAEAACAAPHCKRKPCPAGCAQHKRDCPPPCPAGCTGHARHCGQRRLPAGCVPVSGALVLREIKEKRKKMVPVPPELCPLLREHRGAQLVAKMLAGSEWADHGLVFAQWNGAPVDPRSDWQEWADILKAAGVPHHGVHAGRHTAASIAIGSGEALDAVQALLGHSDSRVTQGYVHETSPAALSAARATGRALLSDGG